MGKSLNSTQGALADCIRAHVQCLAALKLTAGLSKVRAMVSGAEHLVSAVRGKCARRCWDWKRRSVLAGVGIGVWGLVGRSRDDFRPNAMPRERPHSCWSYQRSSTGLRRRALRLGVPRAMCPTVIGRYGADAPGGIGMVF